MIVKLCSAVSKVKGGSLMAEIILIHGMGQEQETADTLEARWLPALAGGIRVANESDLADRIWRSSGLPTSVDVRVAAYGDLYLTQGTMGTAWELDSVAPSELALVEGLAVELLTNAAQRIGHPDHELAIRELHYMESELEEQGLGKESIRVLINVLARFKCFSEGTMSIASRVHRPLLQVARYTADSDLRARIHERVMNHVGPETVAIVGHSLGSVVAYEVAVNLLEQRLPLLVTLGSPLGLRSIIYDRLQAQPPAYPKLVNRWVNVADRNDLVAAEPKIQSLFASSMPVDVAVEDIFTISNGNSPHRAEYYLSKAEVGRPIAEAFKSGLGLVESGSVTEGDCPD